MPAPVATFIKENPPKPGGDKAAWPTDTSKKAVAKTHDNSV